MTLFASTPAFSEMTDEVIDIWPEGVPEARTDGGPEQWDEDHLTNVHSPSIKVFRPDPKKDRGSAVVVCPGGGYGFLAMGLEGWDVGKWLGHAGMTVFVLRYRMGEYGHPHPLRDVLRAMRTVRSRAEEFGVKPDRIGVLGFSAGGHLASSAATLFNHADGKTGAAIDEVSARPDFAVLVYPVITMVEGPAVHAGSRENLIGEDPSREMIELLSTDLQVTSNTPPTLLIHAGDDDAVPAENSIQFYQALLAAGVPAELHIHEKGGHGFGMNKSEGTVSDWTARVEDWMRSNGWMQ